jgi:hypothetical protein
VASKCDLSPASLDQVIKRTPMSRPKQDGTKSVKALGDASARKIEDALRLGRGWFDAEHEAPPTLSAAPMAPALQEPDEIARALRVLAKAVTGVDKATQVALERLFAMLLAEPDQHVNIAHAVCKLLPTAPVARRLHDDEVEGGLILDLPGGGMIQSERVSDQKREKGGR